MSTQLLMAEQHAKPLIAPVVKLSDLNLSFGEKKVLNGVSLICQSTGAACDR